MSLDILINATLVKKTYELKNQLKLLLMHKYEMLKRLENLGSKYIFDIIMAVFLAGINIV